jgi:dolichol-phosphate mannosyltransferase
MTQADKTKSILVILPTYNEAADIANMVDSIKSLDIGASILIIDDNSPDGTGNIVDELSNKYQDVFVIHREKKLGLGSAYIQGFHFGLEKGFAYICEMDADFSHDPKYLIDFHRYIQNYDLVIGSRYKNGVNIVNWPFSRLVISFLANKYVKFITGLPFSDCMGGFKCFRSEVIRDIGLDNIISHGYVFQMEMLYRAFKKGYRITEIPIIFLNRKHGKSKLDKSEAFESFFVVLYLKFILVFKPLYKRWRYKKP